MSTPSRLSPGRTLVLTLTALIAFAANSVLCRLALGDAQVDAASYTSLRLLSGVLMLWLVVVLTGRSKATAHGGNWLSGGLLFLYAVTLSFAYITLETGIGALILFGAVQVTMILVGVFEGHRPNGWEWAGMLGAFGGLLYLVSPGLGAPEPVGAALMAVSGIAWGLYSLRGRSAGDPVAATAANFTRALPFALLVSLFMLADLDITARGAWLAILSGAVASGLGYVVWYAALRGLNTTRAAVVQLSVPVLATLGGVLFMAEAMTLRLVVSGIVILGGIALAIRGRSGSASAKP